MPPRERTRDSRNYRRLFVTLLACGALLSACKGDREEQQPSRVALAARTGPATASGDTTTRYADDGQWVRPAKDFQGTRFSGLTEINNQNVQNLHVIGTFSTGVTRGHEAAPIVSGSTMYIVTPFPNFVYALDLTDPKTKGFPTKWSYKPRPVNAAQGVACCDVVNRGLVVDNGKVIFNTLDARTIALDAATGKELWVTQVGNINLGESMTMAPLVVKGKVFVGVSGGEFGVRGWLKALDENSGKIAWTAYHTGPDKDVLIGPNFKPFYAMDRGKDLGVTSWPADQWKIGGAGVWGWITYDPELDLIYYGTANPGPWNPEVRPGDNKWGSTIFARRPDNGEAIWAYQVSPHDEHDYDAVNENILVDMDWRGSRRQLILRPERNGYFYIIDRKSGEVLSAEPFGFINTTTGVDLKTGRLQYVPQKATHTGEVTRYSCPAAPGAKDWQPSAYSPRTGLVYIPHQNLCMDEEGLEHPVRGHECEDVRWTRRPPWSLRRVGPCRAARRLEHQGRSPSLEWGARHRGRRGLLRHHGRLVQGRRCTLRKIAVAVQNWLGHHQSADDIPRARWQAVHRGALRRWWLVRRDRRRRSRCAGLERRPRLHERDEGSPAEVHERGDAVCLCALSDAVIRRERNDRRICFSQVARANSSSLRSSA
jgi:PQQ-dependent dehydrogenase (methanol/ethanol family)